MPRKPFAKGGQLKAQWHNGDLMYCWGDGVPKSDAHLMHNTIGGGRPSFLQELKDRGYDLKTFKFSISKIIPGEGKE